MATRLRLGPAAGRPPRTPHGESSSTSATIVFFHLCLETFSYVLRRLQPRLRSGAGAGVALRSARFATSASLAGFACACFFAFGCWLGATVVSTQKQSAVSWCLVGPRTSLGDAVLFQPALRAVHHIVVLTRLEFTLNHSSRGRHRSCH